MFRKGDIMVVVFIIALFLTFSGSKFAGSAVGSTHLSAEIFQNGRIVRKIDLATVKKAEKITLHGGKYTAVILAEPGRIRYLKSNCPDKICVRTGWLGKSGDFAACVPGKTYIKIKGGKNTVDAVAK